MLKRLALIVLAAELLLAALDAVNTLSLLYTWKGTDPNAKPVALLAHHDVVPIEPGTETRWQAGTSGVAREMFETLPPELSCAIGVALSNLWPFGPIVQGQREKSASMRERAAALLPPAFAQSQRAPFLIRVPDSPTKGPP